jgi:hypothetical protein
LPYQTPVKRQDLQEVQTGKDYFEAEKRLKDHSLKAVNTSSQDGHKFLLAHWKIRIIIEGRG